MISHISSYSLFSNNKYYKCIILLLDYENIILSYLTKELNLFFTLFSFRPSIFLQISLHFLPFFFTNYNNSKSS